MFRLDTALGRNIDWSYPSNRFAVIGSGVGTVLLAITRLIGGRPVTLGNLVGTFLALFLSWAVAREVDPDETLSASTALVLAFLAVLQFGFATLWLVVGVLLGVRLIVGTVGVSTRWGDVAALVLLAAYVGYRHASWIVIAVLTLGAVIAGGRRRTPAALLVVAGGVAGLAASAAPMGLTAPGAATLVALVGVVASLVILWNGPAPMTPTDRRERTIEPERLLTGRVAATVTVVTVAFQTGSFTAVSPVAAALLAAASVRFVRYVQTELAG